MESGGKCGEIVEINKCLMPTAKALAGPQRKLVNIYIRSFFNTAQCLPVCKAKATCLSPQIQSFRESTAKLSLLKQYKDIQREACGSLIGQGFEKIYHLLAKDYGINKFQFVLNLRRVSFLWKHTRHSIFSKLSSEFWRCLWQTLSVTCLARKM